MLLGHYGIQMSSYEIIIDASLSVKEDAISLSFLNQR
jgi:hypothetical protein